VNKNLKIGYFLAFVNELYLPIAIWLLFFLQYLDFTQVAIIGALSTISSNIFEIPTGAISDLIGRKWTLFLSFILSSVGLFVIATGNVFLVFAIGRIINGLGTSLYSGTHESLMYDTLKSEKKEKEYDHVVAKVETYTWIGLFIAAVSGGVLYDFWQIGPFVVTAIIYVFAAILCLFLDEPKVDSEIFSLNSYVKQNLKGFSELFKDRKTTVISLLMITVASGYFFASKILGISQAEQYGLSGTNIGFLFGSGYIVAALASYFYPKLRRKFGNTILLVGATITLLSSFIFAPFVGVVLGSLLITLRISSSTTFGNAKSVIMNRFIASKNRSTALSTLALLSQIPFTLSFYFVGKYIDSNFPNNFALLLGICLLIALVPQILLARNYVRN
jgi:MFS family permease